MRNKGMKNCTENDSSFYVKITSDRYHIKYVYFVYGELFFGGFQDRDMIYGKIGE